MDRSLLFCDQLQVTGTNKSVLLGYNRHVIARHARELEIDASGRVPSQHVRTVIAHAMNHCGHEASWEIYFGAGQAQVPFKVVMHFQYLYSTDEGRAKQVFEEN